MCLTYSILLLLGIASITYGDGHEKMAKCVIQKTSGSTSEKIQGTITFTEKSGATDKMTIKIALSGFNTSDSNTKHGFHVHQNGDLNNGCKAAGGHYNPTNKTHGGPTAAERHVGDLGNVEEDANGAVSVEKMDGMASLYGNKANRHSILNRSIVVHAMEDDLGLGNSSDSKKTGAAGARLGCCIIVEDKPASSAVNMAACFYITLTTLFITLSNNIV